MSPAEIAPIQRLANDPCGPDSLKIDLGVEAEGKALEAKVRAACRKIAADGKGFGRAVYENVPKMMFIFLPLIAMVMFVLYLGSGRYYVEHLLFFVHFHSFFFLAGMTDPAARQPGHLVRGHHGRAGIRCRAGHRGLRAHGLRALLPVPRHASGVRAGTGRRRWSSTRCCWSVTCCS